MDVTILQPVFAVGALLGSLYAGYDLVRTGSEWTRRPLQTFATVWLATVLGFVAVEFLIFGNNAVMLIARQLDLPMQSVQIGYLASIVLAVLLWSRE